jgi:hypothetical protein
MARVEQMAQAALAGEALLLRELALEWLRENPHLAASPAPVTEDPDVRVVAAGLVELLADRCGQPPPPWAAEVGGMREPRFLVESAKTMPRLRRLCEAESPLPLRRRGLFAPANFLSFA